MPLPTRTDSSQHRVRQQNLEQVADLVRTRAGCSRGEIGAALGLNKGTVSSLVGELISRGLLQNAGQSAPSGPGRPRMYVRPDTTEHVSLVVEILTDRVRLSSWTLAATPVDQRTIAVAPMADGARLTLRRTADAVERWVRRTRAADKKVTGIAVSVPGLVNTRTGTVVQSTPLRWEDVDLAAALRRRSQLADLPILVDRVANLAAVAEWRQQPDLLDFVCLHGGETGLGVGVVTGGRLLTGANGRAGGLLFADNVRSSRSRLVSPPPDYLGFVELLDLVRDSGSTFTDEAEALAGRLLQGDQQVLDTLDRFGDRLSTRLLSLLELFDPSEVVFAGPLQPLAEHLIPRLRTALDASPIPIEATLTAGRSGPEASLIGGAILLADRAFALTEGAAA